MNLLVIDEFFVLFRLLKSFRNITMNYNSRDLVRNFKAWVPLSVFDSTPQNYTIDYNICLFTRPQEYVPNTYYAYFFKFYLQNFLDF